MTMIQTTPKNDRMLALMDEETQHLEMLETIATESQMAMQQGGQFVKAVTTARAIKMIRDALSPAVMDDILPLMNTPLGFKTDRDPKKPVKGEYPTPYHVDVVRDCVIVATLKGAALVGNEFNIIAGQTYLTKEFFTRVLGQLDGVTNIVESPGLPIQKDGKTVVRFGLSWKKDGVADCLKGADGTPGRVFEIIANQYSGADQIIGKATRKAYAAAYRQITGSQLVSDDGDVTDFVEGQLVPTPGTSGHKSDAAAKLAEMKANGNGNKPPEAPAPHQNGPATPPAASGAALNTTPASEMTVPESSPNSAPTGAGSDPAVENLAEQLAAMPPEEFERNLYAKAKEVTKGVTRQPFGTGTFLYAKAHGSGAAGLAKMDPQHRLDLWNAVARGHFDFKSGAIIDPATGQVAE